MAWYDQCSDRCAKRSLLLTYKHGDIGVDGRVFWSYNAKSKGGEDWRSPDQFHKTKQERRNRATRLRKIRRKWLDYLKMKCGCQMCGYKENPFALQFDHITGNKRREVSDMVTYNLKTLMTEVRKCRVLCANCHMIHTINGRKK